MVISILLVTPLLSSGETLLTSYNGHDWQLWNDTTKLTFIQGFMLGSYIVVKAVHEQLGQDFSAFYFSGELDQDILEEIGRWYQRTERYDYPIYFVIYIRNRTGEFPPWQDYQELGWY
jgi:hypothetical protein